MPAHLVELLKYVALCIVVPMTVVWFAAWVLAAIGWLLRRVE